MIPEKIFEIGAHIAVVEVRFHHEVTLVVHDVDKDSTTWFIENLLGSIHNRLPSVREVHGKNDLHRKIIFFHWRWIRERA